MDKKSINSNKQFMIGNGILAFGVFFIVCLFLYLGFRGQDKQEAGKQVFKDMYTISLTKNFAGDSISVYINDSLLMNRTMPDAEIKLQVNRFADESALMIVDNRNEEITPFSLNVKGSLVTVDKKNGKIFFEETEAADK